MYNILGNVCQIRRIISAVRVKPNINYISPKRNFCVKVVDTNTNVTKDVILFKYINSRYFRIVNIFSVCQFLFWTYLSTFAFSTLRDTPVEKPEEETVWWRKINFGENKYKNGLTILSFSVGFGILALTWMYTLRSVKYIILRKGGKQVTIVTHSPFGENRMLTLGLENLNCKQMRIEAKNYLPIKVRGRLMHYMLDMQGEFKHPELFDSTCGLARRFK